MGRVFGEFQANGKRFRTLFDSGATHSYIAAEAAKSLPKTQLPEPFSSGIGGKPRQITEFCTFVGKLEGKQITLTAYVLDDIGRDKQGRSIDILFGALAMQEWDIVLLPKEERLDLSHYSKEFIEFIETLPTRGSKTGGSKGHGRQGERG